MHRRLLSGALAAACVVALSACGVRFDGAPQASQPGVIGDVVVTTKLCSESGGACGTADVTGTGRSLLAYRVADGTGAPSLVADSGLAYERDDALARYYEGADHADGMRWYAFVSEARDVDAADRLSWTVRAAFPQPARGPFAYKVVTGYSAVTPVDCGPKPVFDERPATTDCTAASATDSVPTRDLALAPDAPAAAAQGATGEVRFVATFFGSATPDADFALSATVEGLTGATVTPDRLVPDGDGATPMTVRVAVPAGAALGDHAVTLTARLANGQTRTATGRLTVVAPRELFVGPADAPGVTVQAPSTTRCLSRRVFTIMLLRHGRRLQSGTVRVNGKPVRVVRRGSHLTARVDLRGLTAGTVAVAIRAVLADGRTVSFTRRYRTCATAPGDNGLTERRAI